MSGHATRPDDPGGQAVLERCIQVAVLPIAGKHTSSTSPATSVPLMERQDVDVIVRKHIKTNYVCYNTRYLLSEKHEKFILKLILKNCTKKSLKYFHYLEF